MNKNRHRERSGFRASGESRTTLCEVRTCDGFETHFLHIRRLERHEIAHARDSVTQELIFVPANMNELQ